MAQKRWHQSWFDEDYLSLYAHRSEDEARTFIHFLEAHCGLEPRPDAPLKVADLGCGAGRHSLQLSQRGHQVVAMDWSLPLLKKAQRDAAGFPINDRPHLLRGDLLHLPLRAGFDWVLSLFTSFGYNECDRENREQLAELAALAKEPLEAKNKESSQLTITAPRILIDFLNPHFLRKSLVKESQKEVGTLHIQERRHIDEALAMVEKRLRIENETGQVREVIERVKLYDAAWFLNELSGFRLLKHFGDYEGSEFTDESPRSILLLEAEARR